MSLREIRLTRYPDSTTFLNGLGQTTPPRPPPPPGYEGRPQTTISEGAPVETPMPAKGGCPAGTVAKVSLGGKKVCVRKAAAKPPAVKSESTSSEGRSPGTVYSPNEEGANYEGDVTIISTPSPAPSASPAWVTYAKWGGLALGALGLGFGAYKGWKYLRARKA